MELIKRFFFVKQTIRLKNCVKRKLSKEVKEANQNQQVVLMSHFSKSIGSPLKVFPHQKEICYFSERFHRRNGFSLSNIFQLTKHPVETKMTAKTSGCHDTRPPYHESSRGFVKHRDRMIGEPVNAKLKLLLKLRFYLTITVYNM